MKYTVNWKVLDNSDAGSKQIGQGQAVKEAADDAAMQRMIDTELMPALKSYFGEETEFTTREFFARFTKNEDH